MDIMAVIEGITFAVYSLYTYSTCGLSSKVC